MVAFVIADAKGTEITWFLFRFMDYSRALNGGGNASAYASLATAFEALFSCYFNRLRQIFCIIFVYSF